MQAAMENAAAMSLKNSAVISTHKKISYGKIIHACSVVEQKLSTHFHYIACAVLTSTEGDTFVRTLGKIKAF